MASWRGSSGVYPNSSSVISQFTNPSLEVVFPAPSWAGGGSMRKNFPASAKAEAVSYFTFLLIDC